MSMTESSFNPFDCIGSEKDIPDLVDCIMEDTKAACTSHDPCWFIAEKLLLKAIIALQYNSPEQAVKTLSKTPELLTGDLDTMFEKCDPDSMATKSYKSFAMAAGKTRQGIITTVLTRLSKFDTEQARLLKMAREFS